MCSQLLGRQVELSCLRLSQQSPLDCWSKLSLFIPDKKRLTLVWLSRTSRRTVCSVQARFVLHAEDRPDFRAGRTSAVVGQPI